MAELLTVWMIRMSLALLAATLVGWMLDYRRRFQAVWRVMWTIGFVLAVSHVAAAFHFYHGWSHRAAYDDTAEQTRELLGRGFGAGVYFNYLFIVVWGIDVANQWRLHHSSEAATGWLRLAAWIYLAFIAINGAVVFESGPSRLGGIIAITALSVAVIVRWQRTRSPRIV